jgi:hypothetical protein
MLEMKGRVVNRTSLVRGPRGRAQREDGGVAISHLSELGASVRIFLLDRALFWTKTGLFLEDSRPLSDARGPSLFGQRRGRIVLRLSGMRRSPPSDDEEACFGFFGACLHAMNAFPVN